MKIALISVYDKSNLCEFARLLEENQVKIISTGGTYRFLLEHNIKVTKLSEYTGYSEIFDGRVKTLHPKIHGGILANRSLHEDEMLKLNIPGIDFVVVNLYPFSEYAKNKRSEEEIIENIDIGGVTLLRSAAKNFKNVTVLSDVDDYEDFQIDNNIDYRKEMARKAFALVSEYDYQIASWFNSDDTLPDNVPIIAKKRITFRYGENPHQDGGFYSKDDDFPFTKIQGKELSYNNILDSESAFKLLNEFRDPTAVIVKHNNPCGIASSEGILLAYKNALSSDDVSAFGGIVAVNREITKELAEELAKIFFEVIISPEISEDAKDILRKKKDLRILTYDSNHSNAQNLKIRSAFNGFLVQESDDNLYKSLSVVTKRRPNDDELKQLEFSWKICKYVKSNAIVVTKDFKTIGIGAGQMNRVGSVDIALKNVNGRRDLSLASDAFFPFPDSVELAAKNGVSAIIQPGGSIKDKLVIEVADRYNLSMVFTGMRHFLH